MSFGRKAEAQSAKRLGVKQQPNSGSLPGAKGDHKDGKYLYEQKSSEADSIRVQFEWIQKIRKQAVMQHRQPVLHLLFASGNGKPRIWGSWFAVPELVWKELTGEDPPGNVPGNDD